MSDERTGRAPEYQEARVPWPEPGFKVMASGRDAWAHDLATVSSIVLGLGTTREGSGRADHALAVAAGAAQRVGSPATTSARRCRWHASGMRKRALRTPAAAGSCQ